MTTEMSWESESVAQNSKQRGDSFEGGDGNLPHFPQC